MHWQPLLKVPLLYHVQANHAMAIIKTITPRKACRLVGLTVRVWKNCTGMNFCTLTARIYWLTNIFPTITFGRSSESAPTHNSVLRFRPSSLLSLLLLLQFAAYNSPLAVFAALRPSNVEAATRESRHTALVSAYKVSPGKGLLYSLPFGLKHSI